jgi:hypothetical protein
MPFLGVDNFCGEVYMTAASNLSSLVDKGPLARGNIQGTVRQTWQPVSQFARFPMREFGSRTEAYFSKTPTQADPLDSSYIIFLVLFNFKIGQPFGVRLLSGSKE